MAEDQGDKTEAPTQHRRDEAREEGNVARSADLIAASLLLGILFLLKWYGPGLWEALLGMVKGTLKVETFTAANNKVAEGITGHLVRVGLAMAPILGGVVVIAILANVVQVGLHVNTAKLAPDFNNVNPIKGFSRLFKGQGFMRLLMGILKMVLVGGVAYSAVHDRLGQILRAAELDYMQIFALGSQIVFAIGLRVGLLLLILAVIDYGFQKYQFEQSLKMTKQEVKEEMKRMDGDPKIKQRRRQIAQQMAQKRLKKDVPTADVIVTNPTEFAVALKYDSASMHAPRVVAKGADLIAKRIREIAIEHGIPILERKPLARALYKMCEVGQEIPEEFYSTVAEILAYVYQLTGKTKQPAVATAAN